MSSLTANHTFKRLERFGALAAEQGKKIRRAQLEADSAVLIQSLVRGFLGRKRAQRKREKRDRQILERAVLRIQSIWRGRNTRIFVEQEKRRLEEERRQSAALCIQSVFRGHLARKRTKVLRQERQRARETRAAIVIQSAWRGRRHRLFATAIRAFKLAKKRERAAIEIQRVFRGNLGRRLAFFVRFSKNVRLIQRVFRGYLGRLEAQRIRKLRDIERAALDTTPIFTQPINSPPIAVKIPKRRSQSPQKQSTEKTKKPVSQKSPKKESVKTKKSGKKKTATTDKLVEQDFVLAKAQVQTPHSSEFFPPSKTEFFDLEILSELETNKLLSKKSNKKKKKSNKKKRETESDFEILNLQDSEESSMKARRVDTPLEEIAMMTDQSFQRSSAANVNSTITAWDMSRATSSDANGQPVGMHHSVDESFLRTVNRKSGTKSSLENRTATINSKKVLSPKGGRASAASDFAPQRGRTRSVSPNKGSRNAIRSSSVPPKKPPSRNEPPQVVKRFVPLKKGSGSGGGGTPQTRPSTKLIKKSPYGESPKIVAQEELYQALERMKTNLTAMRSSDFKDFEESLPKLQKNITEMRKLQKMEKLVKEYSDVKPQSTKKSDPSQLPPFLPAGRLNKFGSPSRSPASAASASAAAGDQSLINIGPAPKISKTIDQELCPYCEQYKNQISTSELMIQNLRAETMKKGSEFATMKQEKIQLERKLSGVEKENLGMTTAMRRLGEELTAAERKVAELQHQLISATQNQPPEALQDFSFQVKNIRRKVRRLIRLIEEEGTSQVFNLAEFTGLQEDGRLRLQQHEQKHLILLGEISEDLDGLGNPTTARSIGSGGGAEQQSFFITEMDVGSGGGSGGEPSSTRRKRNKIDTTTLEKALESLEKRERDFQTRETEILARERGLAEKLSTTQNELLSCQQMLNAQISEVQSLSRYKELIGQLQSKLDQKEREMEDQNYAFEKEMRERMRTQEADRKVLQEQMNAMAERQRSLEEQESELHSAEAEHRLRESTLKKKEDENSAMLAHLTNVLETQQKRDKQAQEELKKGYVALKEKYDSILSKEKQLNDFKTKLEDQANLQRKAIEDLNSGREKLLRQVREANDRERRLEETLSEKKKELMSVEAILTNKKRDVRALQDKEQKAQGLIDRLGERERETLEKDKKFQEIVRVRKQEMQRFDDILDAKKREIVRVQQQINERKKELEFLENSEISNITSASAPPPPPSVAAMGYRGGGMQSPMFGGAYAVAPRARSELEDLEADIASSVHHNTSQYDALSELRAPSVISLSSAAAMGLSSTPYPTIMSPQLVPQPLGLTSLGGMPMQQLFPVIVQSPGPPPTAGGSKNLNLFSMTNGRMSPQPQQMMGPMGTPLLPPQAPGPSTPSLFPPVDHHHHHR